MGGCLSSAEKTAQPHGKSGKPTASSATPMEPLVKHVAVECSPTAHSAPLGEVEPQPDGIAVTEEPTARVRPSIGGGGLGAASTEAGPSFRDMSDSQPQPAMATSSQVPQLSPTQAVLLVLPPISPSPSPSPAKPAMLTPIRRPLPSSPSLTPSPESLSHLPGPRPQRPSRLARTPTESPTAPGKTAATEANLLPQPLAFSPSPSPVAHSVGLSPLGNPSGERRWRSSAASGSDAGGPDSPFAGPDSLAVLGRIMGLGSGDIEASLSQSGQTGELKAKQEAPSPSPSKPSADDIMLYARQLGMDMAKDSDLLWIAEQALQAPVPANWSVYYDAGSGNGYYANEMTGVTTWEHPLDEHFRAMYVQMSQEKDRARVKSELQSLKLQAKARQEQQRGKGQSRAGQGPAWRQTLDDTFRTDGTGTDTDFDESRTSWGGDSSLATSRDSALTRTMDLTATTLDSQGFTDTYDSLNMSLSTSKVGGLQLSLAGIQQRQLRDSRGSGLGLQLRVHKGSRKHNKQPGHDQRSAQRQFSLGSGHIPVFSKMTTSHTPKAVNNS